MIAQRFGFTRHFLIERNTSEKNEDRLKDILVKVTGQAAYEAGIDNKVIRYRASHGGNGVDYRYKKEDKWLTRLTTRKNWGWQQFEIYFGRDSYTLRVDNLQSRDVRPVHLWTAYDSESAQ
ncbi:MAG: hypothetical protein ACR2RB_07960 [Gammaproteobacteria bacterium]